MKIPQKDHWKMGSFIDYTAMGHTSHIMWLIKTRVASDYQT